MLLQFSVKNFRTFKDKVTLSLVASNYDKETLEVNNVFENTKFKHRLLKSAVVFGANASGKSKLFEAIAFTRSFVLNSSKESQRGEPIDVETFQLSEDTEDEPSEFEIIFLHNNEMFRYGFESSKERIVSEWLYHKPKTKEKEIFYRDENHVSTHNTDFSKGTTIVKEGLVRDNALLISVAAQFNDNLSIIVLDWFKRLKVISGLNEMGYQGFTINRTKDPNFKTKILGLLKAADFGIQDFELQKLEVDGLPKGMPREMREEILREIREEKAEYISDVLTSHIKFDSNKLKSGTVNFSLDDDESSGTKKFFALCGPILDVLENGYILIVDELDSKLHINLVKKIISLFNSVSLNPKHAQLIFNSHNTNLLKSKLFRRDQIWFTKKNRYGESNLYSLADFKSDEVKKNELYEEHYLSGRYGAVPYLEEFETLDLLDSLYENEK